jgi:hypothetical protein
MPDCDSVNQATLPGVFFYDGCAFWREGWYPFPLRRPCAEVQNRQMTTPVSP